MTTARTWSLAPHRSGAVVAIDHAGHFPYFEAPDATNAAIETFLRGVALD